MYKASIPQHFFPSWWMTVLPELFSFRRYLLFFSSTTRNSVTFLKELAWVFSSRLLSAVIMQWRLSLHWKRMCAVALHVEWTKPSATTFIETMQQHPCIWRAKNRKIETWHWHWKVRTDYIACGIRLRE